MHSIVSKILIQVDKKLKQSTYIQKGKENALLNTHIKNKLCSQNKAMPGKYFADLICF